MLRTCPLASVLSQVRACLGRGATVGVLGTGFPDLPARGLRRGSSSGPVRPIYIIPSSRTSRGAKPSGVDDARLPRGGLTRQAREEAERSRHGVPREVLMTQAKTMKTRRVPGGRQPVQCPRFLFSAKGANAGTEYRGIKQRLPYWCIEIKTSRAAGRRSPWSQRWHHRQCLWQSKTNFTQDSLY